MSKAKTVTCSQPELHLIGDIVVRFGNLDMFVATAIWKLLGDRRDLFILGQAITAEMSFDRKVHAFASMYRIRFPEQAKEPELQALTGVLFAAQDGRNAIVHSAWTESPEEEGAFSLRLKASSKAKRGLRTQFQRVTTARLEEVRDLIEQASLRFGLFMMNCIQDKVIEA